MGLKLFDILDKLNEQMGKDYIKRKEEDTIRKVEIEAEKILAKEKQRKLNKERRRRFPHSNNKIREYAKMNKEYFLIKDLGYGEFKVIDSVKAESAKEAKAWFDNNILRMVYHG